jgi:aconitate hydratase
MGLTLAQKLIKAHLVEGEMKVGSEIGLRIDQTLTQDATGTMAYLEFEAMVVDRVKPKRALLTLTTTLCRPALKMRMTTDISNRYQKARHLFFRAPRNGICHQCI